MSVSALNNQDCDGFFTGDSDFVWEFTGTDNTIGYTNNNPALLGILGFNYAYKNGDNGPYTMTSPSGTFEPNDGIFSHDYICANDVPTQINLDWEAYENDDVQITAFLDLMMDKRGFKVFPWLFLLQMEPLITLILLVVQIMVVLKTMKLFYRWKDSLWSFLIF